jgi:hypothetical protein
MECEEFHPLGDIVVGQVVLVAVLEVPLKAAVVQQHKMVLHRLGEAAMGSLEVMAFAGMVVLRKYSVFPSHENLLRKLTLWSRGIVSSRILLWRSGLWRITAIAWSGTTILI